MEQIFVFFLGAAGYGLMEIIWRGYTHWTMLICGGVCFFLIYNIFDILGDTSTVFKAVAGSLTITFVELFAGLIINVKLGLNVWDYSGMPYNILGQVCLPYSFLWLAVCIPLVYLCKWLKNAFSADSTSKA
ncbi:MAG: hypothetical protein SOZ34_06220 [Clostridia bacterium]|nr:hypothetical protein [Clostridia bacterium]